MLYNTFHSLILDLELNICCYYRNNITSGLVITFLGRRCHRVILVSRWHGALARCLVRCWSSVQEAGPPPSRHWVDVSCLPRRLSGGVSPQVRIPGVLIILKGGGPRVVVSTAAFHARVRGSVPGLGGWKETKLFLPHPRVKVSIVGSLRDREVACSASDRKGSNFESCVWRTVSSQSSHHPQEVLLAQFSLYVHKGGLKPDSFFFIILKSQPNGREPMLF